VGDRLRPLWDFDDLDASEDRFRGQLAKESSDAGRAEVLTQLARVEGLRGAFDVGERRIEEAEALSGASAVARARVDLERGRLRCSSGNEEAALPLIVSAYATALEANELFIAVDAAHMAALAASDREGFVAWTQRGIDVAERADPSVRYWLGSLLNNLGWEYFDAGDHEQALAAFQRALEERERYPENGEPIALARYAVAKALRALGRPGEAVPLLEQAVAWADGAGKPDGWYHEELAEAYTALGRDGDARAHAEKALALLPDADRDFAPDGERADRLRRIAGEAAHGS
jgi:tetratricopeptide (TPR) repeat protein